MLSRARQEKLNGAGVGALVDRLLDTKTFVRYDVVLDAIVDMIGSGSIAFGLPGDRNVNRKRWKGN